MSKTIRNERTRGFLSKLQKARRTRKEVRDMKADEAYYEFDISPRNRIHMRITDAWDDFTASSWEQMNYAID